ncbi:Alpha/Beta hydrolase protein [Bisporella sp. PMI_857]|nr:Alpha/Beta hydrolase protein [Bisporella sp. PMI_857]
MATSTSRIITHPNGQTTHIFDDDFVDPWIEHETIVIQHGFARHGAFWYHWVPILAQKYRVIRRDARGHGQSSYPEPGGDYEYSVNTIIDEIIDTLDQLGLSKVHFLGESTSGIIGEILAAKHPQRLRSLIICSSPTYLPKEALSLFSFGFPSWPTACRQLGSRGWGQALSKVPGTVSVPDPRYIDWWIQQVGISTGEGLAGYAQFLSTLDSRRYLQQIRIPMLILAPARSAATKLEEQKWIQTQIPTAKLEVIDATGHEIYVEKPQDCQKAVMEFISQLGDTLK